MAIPAGTRLGKYEIVGPLGAGGMGEVYRARDPRLGRDVALKILPADFAQGGEASGAPGTSASTEGADRLARFEREARTLAQLNHPNIVTVYDIEEASGIRFLAMELVEGRTLASMIPPGGMALKQLATIATQVAEALAAAHEKGIVHRDLKPTNVMVNDAGRAKVLDFGLAKLTRRTPADESDRANEVTVTQDGSVLGTLPYMAPEVLRGGAADARSDLFSLGVMLHEMATGQRPFHGESGIAVAAAILQQDAPTVGELRPDWPPRFGRIVARCLEKDPRQRTQSALDVSHELQDLLQDAASQTVPTTGSVRAEPPSGPLVPIRRAWTPWKLGLAAAGILLVAVVAWVWRGSVDRLPSAGPPPADIRSVAVLPFANLMNDPAQDYFVDGMHEALITDLAKLGALRVTSRSSVLRYKGSRMPLKQVARELGVDALIEGSILRDGDRVRITAQLIRGDTDEHLWAESYDRDLRNVLSLLDEVSGAIVGEVGLTVLPTAAGPLGRRVAARVDPQAYEAYLRSRETVRTMTNPAEFVRAVMPHLERSTELDPGFADAWAALATARVYAVFFGLATAEEGLPLARDAARRALALSETMGEAWAALGTIALYFEWDLPEAGDKLERAVKLTPHDANVRHAYADYLMLVGRADDGLEQVRIGERDNPDYFAIKAIVGFHAVFARRYEDAERAIRRLLAEGSGELFGVHSALAELLWVQGRTDEALAEYRIVWGADSEMARALESGLGSGGPRAAMKAAADLRAGRGRAGGGAVDVAALYAMAGEPDLAFEWLDVAFASRRPTLLHAAVHPYFDPIRDDPRFPALMQRVGLPNVDPRRPHGSAGPDR